MLAVGSVVRVGMRPVVALAVVDATDGHTLEIEERSQRSMPGAARSRSGRSRDARPRRLCSGGRARWTATLSGFGVVPRSWPDAIDESLPAVLSGHLPPSAGLLDDPRLAAGRERFPLLGSVTFVHLGFRRARWGARR